MRKLPLLLVPLVFLGCAKTASITPAPPLPPVEVEMATLDTQYLTFQYPSSWVANTDNQLASQPGFENVLATYILDMGAETKSQFIINVEPANSEDTIEEFRTMTKELLEQNFENVAFLGEQDTTLDGSPTITLAHVNAGRYWLQSWTLHDNKVFTITLATPGEHREKTMAQVEKILMKMDLKEVSETTGEQASE